MANLPANVIILWPSTNASIPAGWERVTSLDSVFPKGAAAAANPNTTGGSDTHTHTSPTHTHNAVGHRHTGQTSRNGDFETEGGSFSAARDAHVHDWDNNYNLAGTITGGALTDAITYLSGSSLPPYYEIIFIRPAGGTPAPIPAGGIVFYGKTTVPTGWNVCDGNNSTPNLANKYLRGAAAGGNSGGTGGATSHLHSINHTHTARSHTHVIGSGWDSDQNPDIHRNNWAGGGPATDHHTHTIYLNANTAEAGAAYTGTAGSAETVEPYYKKLLALYNNAGVGSKPKDIIALWLGTLADIPRGWILCDGSNSTPDMRGFHLKVTTSTAEIGNTGGANTHSHAASNNHTHAATGTHSHTGYSSYVDDPNSTTGANGNGVSKGHSHPSTSCSSATSSWNNTTVSANSSNNEPSYRTVAFIMFKRELIGGFFVNLMR